MLLEQAGECLIAWLDRFASIKAVASPAGPPPTIVTLLRVTFAPAVVGSIDIEGSELVLRGFCQSIAIVKYAASPQYQMLSLKVYGGGRDRAY